MSFTVLEAKTAATAHVSSSADPGSAHVYMSHSLGLVRVGMNVQVMERCGRECCWARDMISESNKEERLRRIGMSTQRMGISFCQKLGQRRRAARVRFASLQVGAL